MPKPAEPAWRNRIVGLEQVAPDQLLAHPDNWRRHPAAQRNALRGSLDEVGWVDTVLVNTTTGRVVDGHARIEEALSKGEPTVPVIYVELSEEEEKLVLATLDPITAMASTDRVQLATLLGEVHAGSPGLSDLLEELSLEGDLPTSSSDGPGLGQPIIQAVIVFDDEEQQKHWHAFLGQLRRKWPELETHAARIDRFVMSPAVELVEP